MDKVKAMNLEPIPMNNMSFNELLQTVSKLDNTSIVFLQLITVMEMERCWILIWLPKK